jgi:isoleucyl-tRNA synthetase
LQYVPLIRDEVNVKEVQFEADTDKFGKFELKVKGSTGVRLKADMPKVMTAARNGEWKLLSDNRVEVAGNILEVEEFTMQLKAREGITGKLLNSHDGVAILDVKLTPELEQEGIARDLVRLIQMTRKEAGLNVSDRIQLFLNLPAALVSAIEAHKQYICDETLAEILRIVGSEAEMEAMYVSSHQIQGEGVTIAVMKN